MNKPGLLFEEIFSSKSRVKIIKILANNHELNITKIIEKARLNHSNVKIHLHFLIESGLVQEKKFGSIRIYRFREENINARGIKSLIELIEG